MMWGKKGHLHWDPIFKFQYWDHVKIKGTDEHGIVHRVRNTDGTLEYGIDYISSWKFRWHDATELDKYE